MGEDGGRYWVGMYLCGEIWDGCYDIAAYLTEIEMNVFNAVGGLIYGTIVLTVVLFILSIFIKDVSDGQYKISGNWIILTAFLLMLIVAIIKCSTM